MADIYGKGPKGKATKLHSLIIRSLGMCERCGTHENLQCAHIVGRSYSATRTDLRNAFCLCAGCHLHFTYHPVEFAKYIKSRELEELYEDLWSFAQEQRKFSKPFWEDRVEFLTDIHKQITAGEMTLWDAREYEPAQG
jgi:hypothetical protein